MEQSLIDEKPFTYESWPDSDFTICVYPNRWVPRLYETDMDIWGIIFAADTYQLEDEECQTGNGIAFYMNVSKEKIKRFTEELRSEYDALIGKK